MEKQHELPPQFANWLEVYYAVRNEHFPDSYVIELPHIPKSPIGADAKLTTTVMTFRDIKLQAFEYLMKKMPERSLVDNVLHETRSGVDYSMILAKKLDELIFPTSIHRDYAYRNNGLKVDHVIHDEWKSLFGHDDKPAPAAQ